MLQARPILTISLSHTSLAPARRPLIISSRMCSLGILAGESGSATNTVLPRMKRKLDEEELTLEPDRKSQRIFTQHEIHWSPDGNVLLQIDGIRFRLVKSRLASQSTWFKYLFNAHQSGLPENTPDDFDQNEIEETLNSVEVVDGLDLFFLDSSKDYPSVTQFSALLTAMDEAIAYMYEAPPFPILRQILVAANFYRCYLYAKQVQRAILALFPDDPSKVVTANLPFVIEASKLGRLYSGLRGLIRCTYYHLVRKSFKPQAGDVDFGGDSLESLPGPELVILLELQRQLASSWEGIYSILQPSLCMLDAKCSQRQPFSATMRKNYLFDPILGINKIIKQDWSAKGFCASCSTDAISKLKNERTKIWDGIQALTNPLPNESD